MDLQNDVDDSNEELLAKTPESSNNNIHVKIVDAPNWEGNGADINDIGKSFGHRIFNWGPIITILLVVTIGLCTIIVMSETAPPFDSIFNFLNLNFHLLMHYMTATNFAKAATYGPGYVRLGWKPSNSQFFNRLQFCQVCKGFKAPRSHHCSQCDRCVMKMEHHCPWINNCVGHRNHAFFVRFMFYAVLGCIHALYISLWVVVYTCYILFFTNDRRTPLPVKDVYTLIAALTASCLASGVMIAVGMLLYYQVFKVIRLNKTAVEEYICAKAESRLDDSSFIYPYDLGWKRNFKEVLWNGDFPKGDGVWWPIREDCTQFTFSEEQIEQKKLKAQYARIRTIIKDYDGTICLGACKAGLKEFFCQPYTDGRRVTVKTGEKYAITRGLKHWVYGKIVEIRSYVDENGKVQHEYVGTDHFRRGWFPRNCMETKRPVKED